MVASTVSSKMVESMAVKEGFKFVECLTGLVGCFELRIIEVNATPTGFKYIGNTALDLVKEGYTVPFGYEEAIGYMFGDEIRDKDGVAASVGFVHQLDSNVSQCQIRFARMTESLRLTGKTVVQHLHDLYSK